MKVASGRVVITGGRPVRAESGRIRPMSPSLSPACHARSCHFMSASDLIRTRDRWSSFDLVGHSHNVSIARELSYKDVSRL